MADAADNFIFYRFIFSISLVIAGVICIFLGYVLFSRGSGLQKALDSFKITHQEFRISMAGMSIGSVLMLTSVGWAYFSYASLPTFDTAQSIDENGNSGTRTIKISELPAGEHGFKVAVEPVQAEPVKWEIGSVVPVEFSAHPIDDSEDLSFIMENDDIFILNSDREVIQYAKIFSDRKNNGIEIEIPVPNDVIK